MKKLALTYALAAICLSAKAQSTYLTFDVSTSYQPDNYIYRKAYPTRQLYATLPLFNFQTGIRKYLKSKAWFYEATLNLGFSQLKRTSASSNVNNPITDLYPVYFTKSTFYSTGVSLGMGYQFLSKPRHYSITLPIGIITHSIFARKRTNELQSGEYRSNTYFSGALNNWLYFGFYTKPAFEFALAKNPSPWRLALYADFKLLFDSSFSHGPIFLYGGGLGVRYQL